jgi:hypothetical protein
MQAGTPVDQFNSAGYNLPSKLKNKIGSLEIYVVDGVVHLPLTPAIPREP